MQAEAEKFGEHHDARGNLFVDWDAAFNTWLRRAREIDDARGVPREQPDDPLFRAAGEPWVKPPEPPPVRTSEDQAAIDEAFARYQKASAASVKQHSRAEHRREIQAAHEARIAAETDPMMLEVIAFARRKRAELEAEEARQRIAAEIH